MKYLLTLISLLQCCTNGSSQSTDFAPIGAQWYYSQISFDSPYPEGYRLVEVVEESVFQGQLCRKIVGLTGCGLSETTYVFTRHDSTFFWSPHSGSFQLLYDWSASPGDSWLIEGLGLLGDSLRVQVHGVGQRLVGSDTLKSWQITHQGCFDWGEEIVEGIGNFYFLSPSYCLCENGPFSLRCYSDASNAYQFVPYPCDTLRFLSNTGSPATHTPLYKVSPNPFQETTHISADFYLVATTFTLFNHAGTAVIQAIPIIEMTNIHTEHLPSGIYYWKIQNNMGVLQSGASIKL